MINKKFFENMEDISGLELTKKDFVAETAEEIDMFMSLNYKQNVELALEKAIGYTLDINDYDLIKRYMIRDLVVLNLLLS